MHKEQLKQENPRNVEKRHAKEFHEWFKKYVSIKYIFKYNIIFNIKFIDV